MANTPLIATPPNARLAGSGRTAFYSCYSCVLDDSHWETALRYVELNPVRARLAKTAENLTTAGRAPEATSASKRLPNGST